MENNSRPHIEELSRILGGRVISPETVADLRLKMRRLDYENTFGNEMGYELWRYTGLIDAGVAPEEAGLFFNEAVRSAIRDGSPEEGANALSAFRASILFEVRSENLTR